jgi:hypothetical protein
MNHNRVRTCILALCLLLVSFGSFAQQPVLKIAKMKYGGGGDWYCNRTSLPNLIDYCNKNLRMNIAAEPDVVEPGSPEIFSYPFVHLTGHGNVVFTDAEARNLRKYLMSGGFLHIDDNYGLDKFIRREMKKYFRNWSSCNCPSTIRFTIRSLTSTRGCPKSMNTTASPARASG